LDLKKFVKAAELEVIGLDVGSSSVKIVQLKQNNGAFKVVAAGKADIENTNGGSGHSQNVQAVKAVVECFKKSGVQSRFAVCGVSGPEVAVRDFKFPVLPMEEIAGAVQLEAEQVCPFNVAESVVDYQLLPNGKESIRGVLVAATNKLVRRKEKLVKEAALSPVLIDIDGLALSNCLETCEGYESGKATAIMNVGNSYTTLVIVGEGSIPFVRDTSHAGSSITRKIAEQTQMSVEKVSRAMFSEQGDSQQSALLESCMEAACDPLIDDITGTIRYYTAQKKSYYVDKVLVCGGFARARGFVDILDRRLPAHAVLWNPLEKIESETSDTVKSFLQENGYEMAVAAGLAMRSV
jgi:type IV pilus assembly protein PilM